MGKKGEWREDGRGGELEMVGDGRGGVRKHEYVRGRGERWGRGFIW